MYVYPLYENTFSNEFLSKATHYSRDVLVYLVQLIAAMLQAACPADIVTTSCRDFLLGMVLPHQPLRRQSQNYKYTLLGL